MSGEIAGVLLAIKATYLVIQTLEEGKKHIRYDPSLFSAMELRKYPKRKVNVWIVDKMLGDISSLGE